MATTFLELPNAECAALEESSAHASSASSPNFSLDRSAHVVFRGARKGNARSRGTAPDRVAAETSRGEQPVDESLTAFYRALFNGRSLKSDSFRSSVLKRRASACLRAIGAPDFTTAQSIILRDRRAAERALQAVAIGVTSFFRDPDVFDALAPYLTTLATAKGEGLRVLSAGCSDGRELYSVALLLELLSHPARELVGVDCRRSAIDVASIGRYALSEADDVPAAMRTQSFVTVTEREKSQVQVHPRIRERCHWKRGDVLSLLSSEAFDVVCCRNLVIYLADDAATTLWTRLRALVATGGILIVGKAERPPASAGFRRIAPCIYQ